MQTHLRILVREWNSAADGLGTDLMLYAISGRKVAELFCIAKLGEATVRPVPAPTPSPPSAPCAPMTFLSRV